MAELYVGPAITSFDPPQGNVSQYVTIRGRGFGVSKGNSKVYFGPSSANAIASTTFPQICADSVWSDNQVIVKVPNGLINLSNYKITMQIARGNGFWPDIDTSSSTPVYFNFNTALPLAPSACKISPTMGQVNTQVSLWGEYFGAKDANSKVKFYLNHNASGTDIISWAQDTTQPGNIKPDKAIAKVHSEAITGQVKVVKANPELVGNGLNFKVGTCKLDSECGGSDFCCPNGTPFVGSCRSGTDVQTACFPEYKACVYEWQFDTSPATGTPCYAGAQNGFCDITQSQCQLPLTCNPNTCLCDNQVPPVDCTPIIRRGMHRS